MEPLDQTTADALTEFVFVAKALRAASRAADGSPYPKLNAALAELCSSLEGRLYDIAIHLNDEPFQ